MLVAGKKVVVVGGSSGIGLATAEMAKREGADVIVASRNVERLDKVAETLNAIIMPATSAQTPATSTAMTGSRPLTDPANTAIPIRMLAKSMWRAR